MSKGSAPDPVHVLVTLDFPPAFLDRVCAVDDRGVVHHHPVGEDDDPAARVPDGILAEAEVMYTSAVLPGPTQAPRLRWAQLDTSGIDHVRTSPLWHSDATITTLGGVSPTPLAEWVMMMVLAHAHRLFRTEQLARHREWPPREYRWRHLMPHNLRTSTLGIVGYGRIGRELARLARSFGMAVLALRRGSGEGTDARFGALADVAGVTEVEAMELSKLLGACDYLALTVPLTEQTRHMIGHAELKTMKPDAVLINASRGGVVDEQALLQLLDEGHLDLVASDVFDAEPLPPEHPFWDHPRVVITPHVAGFAPDYHDAVARLFTTNLRLYLDGEPLLNVADRNRGY